MMISKKLLPISTILILSTLIPVMMISLIGYYYYNEFKISEKNISRNFVQLYSLNQNLEDLRILVKSTNTESDLLKTIQKAKNLESDLKENRVCLEALSLADYKKLVRGVANLKMELVHLSKFNLGNRNIEIDNANIRKAIENSIENTNNLLTKNFIFSKSVIKNLILKFIFLTLVFLMLLMVFIKKRIDLIMQDFKNISYMFQHAGDNIIDESSFNSKSYIFEIDEVARYLIRNSNHLYSKNKEILEKSKLAMVGEITAQIMHEIATPMTVLNYNAKKLEDSLDDSVSNIGKQNIKMIDRISKIINATKKGIYGGESEKAEYIVIKEILAEVQILVSSKLRESKVNLTILGNLDLGFYCKEGQIIQVLVNLINNSIDAISTFDEKWVLIEANEKDGVIVINVTDSGKGIDKQNLDKLFNPYFTTKTIGKGSGIGLNLAKKLVQNNGGDLIYNPQNPNTQFQIVFNQNS